MSNLPSTPMTPENQEKLIKQLYRLLEKQVQSYHRHRHMGHNTSVPAELALELSESIEYTVLQAGGFFAHSNVEESLLAGRQILEKKLSHAKQLLKLAEATAPDWQTECRWRVLQYLAIYLEHYDPLHLAHRGSENLFYPILIAFPEDIRGIDEALFYLKILWMENQIMAAFSEASLDALWSRLHVAALNQCEQVLTNSIGKILIHAEPDPLILSPEEHSILFKKLVSSSDTVLENAANQLCRQLHIQNEETQTYVKAILTKIQHWTEDNVRYCDLENIFL